MSSNIITFPGAAAIISSKQPITELVRDAASPPSTSKKPATGAGSEECSDGRRKKGAASRSVEPNIQEIPGENGGRSYRVQIRKSIKGSTISFTKTFSKLAMARKWKIRKLAEIELDGVEAVSRSGDTVADPWSSGHHGAAPLSVAASAQPGAPRTFRYRRAHPLHAQSRYDEFRYRGGCGHQERTKMQSSCVVAIF